MVCENCGVEYYMKYGSGRFCCEKCARSFSTKSTRKEINPKCDALRLALRICCCEVHKVMFLVLS